MAERSASTKEQVLELVRAALTWHPGATVTIRQHRAGRWIVTVPNEPEPATPAHAHCDECEKGRNCAAHGGRPGMPAVGPPGPPGGIVEP